MLQVSKSKVTGLEEVTGVRVTPKMITPIQVKTKLTNVTSKLTPVPASFVLTPGSEVRTSELNRLSSLYEEGVLFFSEYASTSFICKELGSMPFSGLIRVAQRKLGSLGVGSFVSLVISSSRDNSDSVLVSTVDVDSEDSYVSLIKLINGGLEHNTIKIDHPSSYVGLPEDESQSFNIRWSVVRLIELLNEAGYTPDSICIDYFNGNFRGVSLYTW